MRNFLSVVAERGGRVESEGRESHVTGLLALAAAPTLQEEEMTAGKSISSSSDNNNSSSIGYNSSSSGDNSSNNSLLLTVCQLLIDGGTSYQLGSATFYCLWVRTRIRISPVQFLKQNQKVSMYKPRYAHST
jgi:hypothetical protein